MVLAVTIKVPISALAMQSQILFRGFFSQSASCAKVRKSCKFHICNHNPKLAFEQKNSLLGKRADYPTGIPRQDATKTLTSETKNMAYFTMGICVCVESLPSNQVLSLGIIERSITSGQHETKPEATASRAPANVEAEHEKDARRLLQRAIIVKEGLWMME